MGTNVSFLLRSLHIGHFVEESSSFWNSWEFLVGGGGIGKDVKSTTSLGALVYLLDLKTIKTGFYNI